MKNGVFFALVILIMIAGAGMLLLQGEDGKINKKGLPPSLDRYYEQGPVYLIDMFELGGSMVGISVNIVQGDMPNATKSYRTFSQNYKNSSRMVPEWQRYYDIKAVEKLGESLDSGNISRVFELMDEVGATCSKCHSENMPLVWNKYIWKDFRSEAVNIATPEGPLQWRIAKMKYLVLGFDGIGVNIRNGNQSGAKKSFDLFRLLFDNMNNTCTACHLSEPKERRYYVSQDVQALIRSMGEKIDNGSLGEAEDLRQKIGMVSCYNCHVLHLPAQFARMEGK